MRRGEAANEDRRIATSAYAPCAAMAFTVLLAGCSSGIDADQARTCRSVIPAVNADDARFEITRTVGLAAGDGVRVDYRVRPASGPPRNRFVECRFGERGALLGLTTDAGAMGELRLQLLRRFWLQAEGAAADPEPVAGASGAPAVPFTLAVGLQHLLLALPGTAVYAMLAAAYALIYGLAGRINLAFGELACVGGYAAVLAVVLAGMSSGVALPVGLALLVGVTAAACYGLAQARFVFAPLIPHGGQRVLIGTIALAVVLQEHLRLAQGSKPVWVPPMLNAPQALARAGDFVVAVTPMALGSAALCALAAIALMSIMQLSRFGRAWRACADDAKAAELMGIDRGAVLRRTFALSAGLAGLAGTVITLHYGTLGYADGIVLGIKALLAAVIGGIGSVSGAFLGGVLLGAAEGLWSALLPIEHRELAIFALLIAFLVLRPSGLFGFTEHPGWVERQR